MGETEREREPPPPFLLEWLAKKELSIGRIDGRSRDGMDPGEGGGGIAPLMCSEISPDFHVTLTFSHADLRRHKRDREQ